MSMEPDALPHSWWDDVVGILTGTFVASLGIFLLKSSSVVTGGTAGLSLLVTYLGSWPFAIVFPLVNLPFFALAVWRKGLDFTARTAVSVLLVSALSQVHASVFGHLQLPVAYAALAGNLLAGVGLLILFRHKSSLGGFNIIALIAQEQFGMRAGYVQLLLDGIIVLSALSAVSPLNVAISAVGAAVLNLSLATNHRPGRYLGY